MIYDVVHIGERPYEFNDTVHYTISFEMNLNLATADREVYHALDWLGDMGGLFDGLRIILSSVVLILTYKSYDTYMVA